MLNLHQNDQHRTMHAQPVESVKSCERNQLPGQSAAKLTAIRHFSESTCQLYCDDISPHTVRYLAASTGPGKRPERGCGYTMPNGDAVRQGCFTLR
jgi:hypothetical protein